MFSGVANFRLPALVLPLLLSLPTGLALRGLEPVVSLSHQIFGAGPGPAVVGNLALPGLFDGLRPLLAGGCWLRANLAWEQRDPAATLAWLEATVALDARPVYFWVNGARMIAYDLPEWEPGPDPRRVEACTQRALGFLEQGLRRHGDDPAILIELANLHLRRRGDLARAAACYRRAAEQPGAPYYAARIHAELLQALGRPDEALAWLRSLLPTLPAHEPAARRTVVEARIRALEAATGP